MGFKITIAKQSVIIFLYLKCYCISSDWTVHLHICRQWCWGIHHNTEWLWLHGDVAGYIASRPAVGAGGIPSLFPLDTRALAMQGLPVSAWITNRCYLPIHIHGGESKRHEQHLQPLNFYTWGILEEPFWKLKDCLSPDTMKASTPMGQERHLCIPTDNPKRRLHIFKSLNEHFEFWERKKRKKSHTYF